jgi:hypothetical protein
MNSESVSTITRRTAEIFLDLLERHDQLVLNRDLLRHQGAVSEMVDFGVLAYETFASEVMIDVTDGQESVEIEIDQAQNVARYLCPETGQDRTLPLDEVQLFRLQPEKLCAEIASQLEIDCALAAYNAPIIADAFWFLGNADFGGANLPVFFARGLARRIDGVIEELQRRSDTEGGLLLYSGKAPNAQITFPGRHFAVGLIDALSTEVTHASLVRPYLVRIVSGLPPNRSDPLFDFDAKSGQLIIRGRKKVFKGIQRDIIAWLWKMRESDQAGFTWGEISKYSHASSRGIDDALGGKSAREQWIDKVDTGRFRLRRD